jgi:hypothetical protein
MKSNLLHQLTIVATALCLSADAQQPTTAGSSIDLASAASSGTAACVATFESHGYRSLGATGVTEYLGCRVTVRHNLLKDSEAVKSVALRVVAQLTGEREYLPELGVPYLLIGANQSNQMDVQKIVSPTASNIQAVIQILERRGLRVEAIGETELESLLVSASKSAPPMPSPTNGVTVKTAPTALEKIHVARKGPTSSPPWSIVVLIVAAIGLLWLLVKKR